MRRRRAVPDPFKIRKKKDKCLFSSLHLFPATHIITTIETVIRWVAMLTVDTRTHGRNPKRNGNSSGATWPHRHNGTFCFSFPQEVIPAVVQVHEVLNIYVDTSRVRVLKKKNRNCDTVSRTKMGIYPIQMRLADEVATCRSGIPMKLSSLICFDGKRIHIA